MFPSPQEREALDRMHRDLWSGIGPKQFGLEMQRNQEIIDQVTSDRAHSEFQGLQHASVFVRSLKAWAEAAVTALSLTPKVR